MHISKLTPGEHRRPKAAVTSANLQASSTPAPKESFTPSASESPSDPLRAAFDNVYNSGGEGTAQLLEDNAQAWNARWRMVESASEQINAQYFCWDHDVFGKALLGHIFKKTKFEGVETKLMVDATGDTFGTRGFKSHIGGRDYLQELTALDNAEAKVYHPHYKKLVDGALHMGKGYISASNHDKILEVDGTKAMTGGRNIGYEYFVHPDDFEGAWRDTDVYIEGPAPALALRDAFKEEYHAPWINEKVRGDLFGNWVKRDIELIGAYAIMDDWLKDDAMSAADKAALRESPEKQKELSETLYNRAVARLPKEGIEREPGRRERKALKALTEEIVRYPELRGTYHDEAPKVHDTEIRILDRTSIVNTANDQMGEKLVELTRGAQKNIVIENPYIVLTDDLLSALTDAGKRGVKIILGTNSPSSTDSDVTQAFFLEDWPKLLATIPNLEIHVATGKRKLHAKVATVDDKMSLVSTYNLDYLSSQVNSEVGALVWGEEFAAETNAGILRDSQDPRNGVVQYTIKRDENGKPVRSDGLPVLDEKGELLNDPEVTYGPENHLDEKLIKFYEKKKKRWNFLRNFLPQLESLETFEFADK